MSKSLRKNKKIRRARVVKFFMYTFFCIIFAGIGSVFYFLQMRMSLYISPIPKNVLGKEISIRDNELTLIEDKLQELKLEVEDINVSQDRYLIKLKNKSEIIISTERNIQKQLSSLQFILTRLTMESRAFNQLDFRFDKPVIRFK